MKAIRFFVRLTLSLGVLMFAHTAFAGPARCSYANQDSSCNTAITTAWQTAPQCPGGAGWTTVAAAKWAGSKYTSPQCSYQPPPTCPGDAGVTTAVPAQWTGAQWTSPQCSYQPPPSCPSGFHETAAPSWNGAGWVGQQCQPNVVDGAICATIATPGYTPQSAYQWYDAYVYNGGSSTNWPVVAQAAGQPANAHPYWAENQPDKGWSIGWNGPGYPTCVGQSTLYHATCWVSGSSATITFGKGSTPIPQNGCGLQH